MRMPSNRWFRGIVLFGAAFFAGSILTGCRGQLSESPPIHPNPNMDFQKRYDPQEKSTFFSDGRAMRKPVAGTVARPQHAVRGTKFYKNDSHLYTGMVNGQFATKLPKQIKLTAALLKRGQDRYDIFCTACHGKTGNGKGVVTLYSSAINPRNFHQVRTIALGQIYSAMYKGAGTMKPYNSQLTVRDRWAVAAYVRALQLSRISSTSR